MTVEPVNEVVERLLSFIAHWSGVPACRLRSTTSLQEDLQLYGDDIIDLLEEYSEQFGVDMRSFQWYRHTGPEGFNPSWIVRKPWWFRIATIPITVEILCRSVESGRWVVAYPDTLS